MSTRQSKKGVSACTTWKSILPISVLIVIKPSEAV